MIYKTGQRVNKFRGCGDIFSVEYHLVNKWRDGVCRRGGDPNHPSVAPQQHWAVFDQLIELDEMRKHKFTSDQRKAQIDSTMDSIISDAVSPIAKQIQNEKQRQEQIAQAEAMTEQQLHDYNIAKRLELIGAPTGVKQNKSLVKKRKLSISEKVKSAFHNN